VRTHPAIRIENLHYAYPSLVAGTPDVPALRGINLVVETGEFLAVMGPIGAGKTTLCLALNGLVPQSTGGIFRGDVWVAGCNTKTHSVAELAIEVGIVFQDPESQLFNITVEDEVAFGPESLGLPADEIERRIAWALGAVGLGDLRDRSPAYLSGGQQRRLALAAVLAMQPGILVLDEPTAGLDPLGRRAILDVIADLRRQGVTIVIATQDADAVAMLADRVIILEAGVIVLEGTPQSVFAQAERLHNLGVDAPDMAELSHCLGAQPPWLTVDQACQALQLGRQESGARSRESISCLLSPYSCLLSPHSCLPGKGITCENVWYRYETGVQALAGVDLTIYGGEYVALIGANGSGKTTLAKQMNGLLRPQQGRVLLDGRDIRQQSTGQLARQVGYVFQSPDHQIFAPTVREEIAFGPRNLGLERGEVDRRVEDALETFRLTPMAAAPPATLGYGQRRLVTLASAHAMQPEVLVLDEPTVGLDRALTMRLMEWASELHRLGTTVIFITHDMRLAAVAPRCLVMDRGQVVVDDPTSGIFAHPDELARAGITPPPIVELSRRLGMRQTPLSVEDFCRILTRQPEEASLL
jgi:energy-coupling factor transporter ATP-binding protein EcfA2